ncbi:MAG: hypothetical protein ACE5Z5_09070 [Candidatus Bathyarchaeia archaeon]
MSLRTIISILKLTSSGTARISQVSEDSGVAMDRVEAIIADLSEGGLVDVREVFVETSGEQKIRLAIAALKEGGDLEEACRYLGWKDFEDIAVLALESNSFIARKNVRFKERDKRYEIDVLGLREPVILSIDCKHWKRSWQRAATVRFVEAQVHRTEALTRILPMLGDKLPTGGWNRAEVLPVVLTLSETPFKVCQGVPVVPVFRFRGFLQEMSTYVDSLKVFRISLT